MQLLKTAEKMQRLIIKYFFMKLNPYLIFEGNAEEVLNFYKEIFSGTVLMISSIQITRNQQMKIGKIKYCILG